MKSFALAFALLVSGVVAAQPTITSFAPSSATAGNTITITGANFSTTAANNIVSFGAVHAVVTAATATQLSVTVPSGASYSFITVTTGGLTAYSQRPFTILLPGGPNAISASSFTPPVLNIKELTAGGFAATMGDFNGDGKSDIFTTRYGTMNVHQNTTTDIGQIRFDKGAGSPAPALPSQISTGDLNGDGKLDVVSANFDWDTNYISVWMNTTPSSGSAISFSTRQDIDVSPYVPFGVVVHDVNADGKPDILIVNYEGTNDLTILLNTTTNGAFTYTTAHFPVSGGGGVRRITVADFDSDGRPDVAIANGILNQVHVLRNTTSGGVVSFAPKIDLIPSNTIFDIASADMNADGKPEIITVGVNTPRYTSVFRNISSAPGTISFAARVNFTHPTHYTETVTIHDVDGDAKPDLVTSNYILKNTSSGSTISCEPAVGYEPTIPLNTNGNFLAMANDLDGDGVAEIIGFKQYSTDGPYYSHIVVHDYIPQPRPNAIIPASAKLGETVTLTGAYFSKATSLKFGNAPEITSFTINSSTSITAIVTDATSGNVLVNSPQGPGQIAGFTLIPGPTITSFSPISGPIGTTVTIQGANFSSTTNDNRVYFGSVRATVTEASASTLKVIVPVGFSEVPITVGVDIRTASTSNPFTVTFSGGDAPFSEKTLSRPIRIGEGVKAYAPVIGDFNGDKKPDIAAIGTGGVHVFINTTANGMAATASPLTLAVPSVPKDITVIDVDGDGRQDIVTIGNSLCVFRNTSTSGSTSFQNAIEFTYFAGTSSVMSDIDGDGRADLISSNPNPYIARNVSILGNINFLEPIALPGDVTSNAFVVADLNLDGKAEIIASSASQGMVYVYPNASSPSVLSVLTPIPITTQELPDFVAVANLDKTGYPDILVLSKTRGTASIISNTSSAGLSFAAASLIEAGTFSATGGSVLGDINGDDNPDMALSNDLGLLNLSKNLTTPGGSFNFETFSKSADSDGYAVKRLVLVDFDGNGELDIIGGNSTNAGASGTQSITLLRNQINEPYIESFTPVKAGTNTEMTVKGENFSSVTGVSLGGTQVASFEINSPTQLTAVIGSGSSGDVSVANDHFVTSRAGYTFFNGPIITSFTPVEASRLDVVTITGIQFTNATAVSFGETPAASFNVESSTSITATPSSGADGKVKVSNAFGSDELTGFTYILITGTEPGIVDLYGVDVYPNPSQGSLITFRLNDVWAGQQVTVTVTDVTGRTSMTLEIMASRDNTLTSTGDYCLLPGIYFLKVKLNGKLAVKKFVVSLK